ncbi:hypothetical protein CDL15_Pgr009155 [Punica granatum]|uniref:Uncharacterized protein n=1 Tax=Punica granatum TaxID=22663 RepID=A0A218WJK8_PUNGR|nr:hypothetical protein CDL15_Pgr009155 [Punica granatum]
MTAPITASSKIKFLGLLRDRSRRSWIVSNLQGPGQTRNDERKIGKKTVKPDKKGEVKQRLCVVVWLSDRNHLFTGEGEGREEPLERVGTTRQSHGKVRYV